MQSHHQRSLEDLDDSLCGLAVYSSDLVPLGRIADVAFPPASKRDTIAGRQVTVEPNATVRFVLDGADLVVSESMIFNAEPAVDRVILNLPARRLIRATRRSATSVAQTVPPIPVLNQIE